MFTTVLSELEIAQSEAKIYETLLKEGEATIGKVSLKSGIHRRNVYDSMGRLAERGLVFEVVGRGETLYKPVEPMKLLELVEEKRRKLDKVMPDLMNLYNSKPQLEAAYIYKGIEGFKNFLRDALEVGEDIYSLGAKGAWFDPRLKNFLEDFLEKAKKKGIKYKHLFDYEVKDRLPEVPKAVGRPYKFLPEEYSTPAMIDFFGDRVVMFTGAGLAKISDDITIFVIISRPLATSVKAWFNCLYALCPEVK